MLGRIFERKFQALPIATRQQLCLESFTFFATSVVLRPDGMDNVFAGEIMCGRDFCGAGVAAVEGRAFGEKGGAGGCMDGAVLVFTLISSG